MFLCRFAVTAVTFGVLPAVALAQNGQFKDALPEKTLAFFTMPDLVASLQEFQATPLAKIWRETELQEFLGGC